MRQTARHTASRSSAAGASRRPGCCGAARRSPGMRMNRCGFSLDGALRGGTLAAEDVLHSRGHSLESEPLVVEPSLLEHRAEVDHVVPSILCRNARKRPDDLPVRRAPRLLREYDNGLAPGIDHPQRGDRRTVTTVVFVLEAGPGSDRQNGLVQRRLVDRRAARLRQPHVHGLQQRPLFAEITRQGRQGRIGLLYYFDQFFHHQH